MLLICLFLLFYVDIFRRVWDGGDTQGLQF